MRIRDHVVLGGVTALALSPALGPTSAALWASSWLIDMDHYWDYVVRNGFRDRSLTRALEYNRVLNREAEGRPFIALHMLHTVEFMGLMGAVAATSGNPWVWAILWGVLLHTSLDLAYVYSRRILFWRAFSAIEYAIRWNIMKRLGKHPELPYHRALQVLSGSEM